MAAAALLVTFPGAQMRVVPVDELQGHAALGLALRHLANTGIVMETTAHPDDEDNGLLVMLNRDRASGRRSRRRARATAVLRTRSAPRFSKPWACCGRRSLPRCIGSTAPSRHFMRAVDFGYSFSIDETFEKWGKDEITADYVPMIAAWIIRPDVIFAMSPTGDNGGQHHNASAGVVARCLEAGRRRRRF